jgi:hypothetical protein
MNWEETQSEIEDLLFQQLSLDVWERTLPQRARVLLPAELGIGRPEPQSHDLANLDALDFLTGRIYVVAMVDREKGRCFYCLRSIDAGTCVLDHLVPQVNGVGILTATSSPRAMSAIRESRIKTQPTSVVTYIVVPFCRARNYCHDLLEGKLRPVVSGHDV